MAETLNVQVARIQETLANMNTAMGQDRESRRVMHEKIDHLAQQNSRQDETIALAAQAQTWALRQVQEQIARVDADLTTKVDEIANDIATNIKPVTATITSSYKFGRTTILVLAALGLTGGTVFALVGDFIKKMLFR